MRSRTPLPQRQQAHWGAFLEAAALFLALCVLGRSAALTLAAVVAAPFPAVQTALWWGQRNLQSETSDPEPEPAAEEQAPPASSAVPEAVQALTGGIEDYLVALQPEKLTRWLGSLLCPCLLVLILVLFGGCLLHPLAGQYGTPTPEYTSGAVLQGVLYGYQTMDTLAALNFGAIIALNIQAQGVTRQEEVQRSTILAGFVAGGLLLAVYAMLGHAGALTGAAVPGLATGADVLTVLADRLFGKAGLVLLAAIFVLACFNTCVGLIACVGEYFHTLVPSVPYPAFAGFFAAASMLLSNLGLADILRLSVPVLNALYPVAILLICLSFVPELEQRHPLVYPLCIGCTALQSVAAALPLGPLSALAKALPLGAVGFGWALPAAVGILAGMLLRPTPHEP